MATFNLPFKSCNYRETKSDNESFIFHNVELDMTKITHDNEHCPQKFKYYINDSGKNHRVMSHDYATRYHHVNFNYEYCYMILEDEDGYNYGIIYKHDFFRWENRVEYMWHMATWDKDSYYPY